MLQKGKKVCRFLVFYLKLTCQTKLFYQVDESPLFHNLVFGPKADIGSKLACLLSSVMIFDLLYNRKNTFFP